jgi:hypothetical protein
MPEWILKPAIAIGAWSARAKRIELLKGSGTIAVEPRPHQRDNGDRSAHVGFYLIDKACRSWSAPPARSLPRVIRKALGGS